MSIAEFLQSKEETVFYRDQLRVARYEALADSEGFAQICWAIESLGRRLNPKGNGLYSYKRSLKKLIKRAGLDKAGEHEPTFSGLFERIRIARNDVAHTGVYARHATSAAVDIALILESALMLHSDSVSDHMIRDVVICKPWQSLAQARSIMLKNSFSYLPIYIDDKWNLLSDLAVAEYKRNPQEGVTAGRDGNDLNVRIDSVKLSLIEVTEHQILYPSTPIAEVLKRTRRDADRPWLWLVIEPSEPSRLLGVMSPFELL